MQHSVTARQAGSFLWVFLGLAACCCAAAGDETQSETRGPRRGTLVAMGGGGKAFREIFSEFVELAGGREARIVIVTTASSSRPNHDYAHPRALRLAEGELKLNNVKVLHTHDRGVADSESFVAPLNEATGLWFTGGRQWRLVDAYAGTRAERAFRAVLERDGVIGGSSAGATIQGSFLVRGDTRGSGILIGDHQHGFGYLQNCAIDQHVIPRKRQRGLIEVLTDPMGKMDASIEREALLGIGLDEDTAIVVRGDAFEVIGKPDGRVLIYNPRTWDSGLSDEDRYLTLFRGGRYDLKRRNVLDWGREATAAESESPSASE